MADTTQPANPIAIRHVSAERAMRKLKSLRLTPVGRSLDRLDGLRESSRILSLYRMHFPQRFASSTASTSVPPRADECGYSERETEFFTLVDRELFPLPEFLLESERLPSIPVYPQGVDWEDDRENFRLSLRVTMAMVSGEDEEDWSRWVPRDLHPDNSPRNWTKFESLCKRAGGLTSRLPLLFDFVTHGTGNIWLDTSWEYSYEDLPWEERSMTYLIDEWRKAQQISARLDPLLDHIDAHPRYWLRRIVTLWNDAGKFVSPDGVSEPCAEERR